MAILFLLQGHAEVFESVLELGEFVISLPCVPVVLLQTVVFIFGSEKCSLLFLRVLLLFDQLSLEHDRN